MSWISVSVSVSCNEIARECVDNEFFFCNLMLELAESFQSSARHGAKVIKEELSQSDRQIVRQFLAQMIADIDAIGEDAP